MKHIPFLLMLSFSLVSCITKNPKVVDKTRAPSSTPPAFSKTLKPLIEKWIKEDPEKMVQALGSMPKQHRENYTLVRKSSSLQESDDLHPRAILFGNKGETIFTFGGNPKKGGHGSIEIADYDDKEKLLNLYEVKFKKEVDVGSADDYISLSADEVFFESENLMVSRANPAKCMHCHGAYYESKDKVVNFARYIWAPYRQWPSVYGEYDDEIQKEEYEGFLAFKKAVKNSSSPAYARYKILVWDEKDASPYHSQVTGYTTDVRGLDTMPNSRMTLLVATNYARTIANFILSEPELMKDNTKFVKQWICDGTLALQYPRSLNSSANWELAAHAVLGSKRLLNEQIESIVAGKLKPQNPNWKFPGRRYDYSSFYTTIDSSTIDYLGAYGLNFSEEYYEPYRENFCASLMP